MSERKAVIKNADSAWLVLVVGRVR